VLAAFKIFNRISTQPSSNRIKLLVVTGKTRTGLSGHEESKQSLILVSARKLLSIQAMGFRALGRIIGRLVGKPGATTCLWN
jgi:hypothetical protein